MIFRLFPEWVLEPVKYFEIIYNSLFKFKDDLVLLVSQFFPMLLNSYFHIHAVSYIAQLTMRNTCIRYSGT